MKNSTNNITYRIKILAVIIFFGSLIIIGIQSSYNVLAYKTDEELEKIEEEISNQAKEIQALKDKAQKYQDMILVKQSQIETLEDQISILDNRIAKKELDIEITKKEITNTKEKISQKNEEIKLKLEEIATQKTKIVDFIKLIYKNDQKSYLEILILNESFSEFFNYLTFTEDIEYKLKDILDGLIALKDELEVDKDLLEKDKKNLESLNQKLSEEKDKLDEEKDIKRTILRDTEYNERIYQQLLNKAKQDQIDADRDVLRLEREKRELINKKQEEENNKINLLLDNSVLSWPVDPSRGLTATFHDKDYPFRHLFEHPAIDIRVAQGTPITAPANAYVGTVKDNGMGYSYIMLIHDNGISTVYGHVSKILVSEDEFVTRGQIIGKTGGAPGTPGAGKLTTGAHLHFEVRLNGIPVNPVDYLVNY